jgi:eukaryotic-like serine/threonine-protein kinase
VSIRASLVRRHDEDTMMRTPNQIAHAVKSGFSALPAFMRRKTGSLARSGLTELGPYTLESKIGEGGMGAVWRARHATLDRPAAVKLIARDVDEISAARFEREAQLTARLSHPNAVTVYDFGKTKDGTFWYAMELIDGFDLEKYVAASGPLSPERVIRILVQLCGALAEAHDQGLVHRDVKPSNVILSPKEEDDDEIAKLVDFGLVKNIVETDTSALPLTSEKVITGSPMYMSPEALVSPDLVDGRSDLYSLGMLGWFLLVGRAPFEGNLIEVCSDHLHTTPQRPSEVLGRPIPGALEDVLLACMAKRREDRPQNARALRRILKACAAAAE